MAKALFVVSGATYLVWKDGTRYATGYSAEEFQGSPGHHDRTAGGCRPRIWSGASHGRPRHRDPRS